MGSINASRIRLCCPADSVLREGVHARSQVPPSSLSQEGAVKLHRHQDDGMSGFDKVKLIRKAQNGRLDVLKSQAKRRMMVADQQLARVHAERESWPSLGASGLSSSTQP